MLQKLRNAPLSLHSARQCSKNKQASSASGPSAQETRIKFRLERAMGLFGQKPIMKQQHEREKEAPTEEEERQEAREKKEGQLP